MLSGPGAWMARAFADSGNHNRLVVIFLRGAVDGLNVLPPHGEAAYYEARPSIAVAQARVTDLDGHFGLHPALSSLTPLWRERSLAFVTACGSPDPNRSHFDAQDYMESGTPGVKSTPDGWMNRLLARDARPPSGHRRAEYRSGGAADPLGPDGGCEHADGARRGTAASRWIVRGSRSLSRVYTKALTR